MDCTSDSGFDVPWEARQNISSQQHLDVDSKELDHDETCDEEKRSNHSPSVADSLRDDAVDKETDDLSTCSSVSESILPLDLDLIRLYTVHDRSWFAVLSGESGHGVEITEKPGIVAFHHHGQGETEGEEDSERVQFDTLTETHLSLRICSSFRVGCEFSQVWDGDRHLSKCLILLVEDAGALSSGGGDRSCRDDG